VSKPSSNTKALLRVRETNVRGWEKGLNSGLETRTEYWDRLVWWQRVFYNHLEIAQIRWRWALGDAGAALDACLKVADHAATQWQKGRLLKDENFDELTPEERKEAQSQDATHFPFATAALLSGLRTGKFSPRLLDVVPSFKEWRKHSEWGYVWNYPDAGLISAIQQGKLPTGWKQLLGMVARLGEPVAESFEKYMLIALKKGADKDLPELIEELGDLFDQRSELDDDEGLPSAEGPGSFNELCVDFRLAALARLCLDKKAIAKLDSIHLQLPK